MKGASVEYFEELRRVMANLSHEKIEEFKQAIDPGTPRAKGTIYIIGNGGSAATASHFACDLTKGLGIRAFCLSDNMAMVTAYANDVGYGVIFASQLQTLGACVDDILIAISCSGTSGNIMEGMNYARLKGMTIIGLTGKKHTIVDMHNHADILIRVPSVDMQILEDCHSAICHSVYRSLRDGK